MKNIAFIDGQNLYMGTKTCDQSWEVNLSKLKFYLERKYNVSEVYYFLGYVQNENEELYDEIQKSGLVLKFREHNSAMLGKKKGNVDSDIIFSVMKRLYKKEDFDKVVLISGDGDYKMLVDFLIEENKFEKILFPNRKYASSLYKKLGRKYFAHLEDLDIKKKISR
ncbi:MAG: NYN domain-containing protein [Candidatus Paceibacterota bacterium]